jgi:hypothetical protein
MRKPTDTEIVNEGAQARREGKPVNSNPHCYHSRRTWEFGWMAEDRASGEDQHAP